MRGKILLSHPTGNEFVRAATLSLHQAGLLEEFHTSIATFSTNYWGAIAKTSLGSEFGRRRFDDALQAITIQHPPRELGRLIAKRLRLASLIRHEKAPFSVDAVYKTFDAIVARRILSWREHPPHGVYAYEDGALETFRAARTTGIRSFYDLPIGYWKTARLLLQNERDKCPEWAMTLGGLRDSDEKLERKDQELAAADAIFVASSFTAKTLENFPGLKAPVHIVPYGFPPVNETRSFPRKSSSEPLKVLFVGGLSQRKGIAYLFSAIEKFGTKVSATIVGQKSILPCPALDAALSRCRWLPSLPHSQILIEMQSHDVLIFPSLFEGFGLVITEAMSQGTPVITTTRTAGADFIEHGVNGWLIPPGSSEAIENQIENLLSRPESIEAVGRNARETARLRPWAAYGQQLVAAITADPATLKKISPSVPSADR